MHGPTVLFLDEPFEAVDPVSTRIIRGVLERFTDAGGTVVFSSHVMEVVERLCDRVAVVHQGRIIAEGPVDELRAGRRLEDVFVDLVGAEDADSGALGWLGERRGGPHTAVSRAQPGVPRLLVRLKVRLVRNRARAQRYGSLLLVTSVVAALVVGFYGAGVIAQLVTADDAPVVRGTLVIGATLFTLAWTVLPLLTFGADESLDPARLTLLPLRRDPLMRGLLLASLVGPAPAFALLILFGAVIGFAGTSLAIVPAVVLLVLFTVALARTVSTLLAATLASRKARDAVVIILPLFFVSLQAVRFVNLTFLGEEEVERISDVLAWLPPGMLGQAVYDAGGGDHGLALLRLLPTMALLPVLVWVWGRALDRTLTTVSTGETASRRRRPSGDLPLLFPGWASSGRHPGARSPPGNCATSCASHGTRSASSTRSCSGRACRCSSPSGRAGTCRTPPCSWRRSPATWPS